MRHRLPIQRFCCIALFLLAGASLAAAATTQTTTAQPGKMPVPRLKGKPAHADGLTRVQLTADLPAGWLIRYTLNGSDPSIKSPAYYQSIHLARTQTVTAACFSPQGEHGPILKEVCRADATTSAPRIAINIDPTDAPELAPMLEKMQAACEQYFPILVERMGATAARLPRQTTFRLVKDMKGVAFTLRGNVYFAPGYYHSHTDDIGSAVHELVHVIQNYPGGNPGWLVEGLADYLRFWVYEPAAKRPRFDPASHKYTDSYQVTGAFLAWVVEKKAPGLIPNLNTAMRTRAYSPDLFVKATGKDLDALWQEFSAAQPKSNSTQSGGQIRARNRNRNRNKPA